MVENLLPLANVLAAVIVLGCFVVVLLMTNVLSYGPARRLGLGGLAALLVSTVLASLNGSLGPWLTYITGSGVDLYGVGSVLVAAIGAAGLVLLARAVVVARATARPYRKD